MNVRIAGFAGTILACASFFAAQSISAQPAAPGTPASATAEDPNKKKKGFFGKIAGIFKDDKPSNDPPAKPADTGGNGKSPQ